LFKKGAPLSIFKRRFMSKIALIALEDGTVFEGISFGASSEREGEVVFNTSMTGYQEILTDPSYKGQIVTMTYPLIGNYGINREDVESKRIQAEGFIVKEASKIYSNFRGEMSLKEYFKKEKIIGIEGIDTRALTKHIRLAGAMKGVISTRKNLDKKRLVKKAKESEGLIGRDMVKWVTCKSKYKWGKSKKNKKFKVAAMDFGIKFNILRILESLGCNVTVVPAKTPTKEILSLKPDGIFLSNGPGDPAGVPYAVQTIRELLGTKPIFGICLGHQLLGLAFGAKTYKLKFGHRGANHPVKDLKSGRIDITSQNHGFCVDMDSLNKDEIELTHINLNDNTLEGMRHKRVPVYSVQYHPEASPGPHDAGHLFDNFIKLMGKHAKKN